MAEYDRPVPGQMFIELDPDLGHGKQLLEYAFAGHQGVRTLVDAVQLEQARPRRSWRELSTK